MTHKELVKSAVFWLKCAKRCNPVFAEKGSAKSREMPDVIGWNSEGSIIIECKVSCQDFRVDAKKQFRIKPETGMGQKRYFLFTQELYKQIKSEIPKGWGVALISEQFHQVKQIRLGRSRLWPFDIKAELYYLRNRILEIQKFGT